MIIPTIVATPTGGVLIASPSSSLREQVLHNFYDHRWPVQEIMGGADALQKLETGNWQLLYLDRRLPDLDAEELIQIIKSRFPGTIVVMLDSDSGPVLAGGEDAGEREPGAVGSQAGEMGGRRILTATRHDPPNAVEALPGMIGCAEAMQALYRQARLVARRSTTVLITGPTGTGKELVARALHQLSPRAARPFLVVDCAAIPESLLESELFGHTRGAAVQPYEGRIRAAQDGTLFLDEVGDLALGLQAKLLRFLDQKEVQRLGCREAVRVDVRVVVATNTNLERRVEQGQFREDLYYRLSAFPLEVPALAKRGSDIEALSLHFLRLAMAPNPPPRLSGKALRLLQAHSWRGNVRELRQVMERAVILTQGGPEILEEHFHLTVPAGRLAAAGAGYCARV